MFIFGLGTGRCGTVSLTELFRIQDDVSSSHETNLCPWNFDEKSFQKNLDHMKSKIGKNHTVVEVAFYLLPYVERMIKLYPDTKFICFKRDKEETILSYMKKTVGRNHWTNPSMKEELGGWKSDVRWDKCYPTYDLPKRLAIAEYWEEYYTQSEIFEQKYPKNFKIFDMNKVLQDRIIQIQMLTFSGLEIIQPVLGIKLNSIKERGPQGRHNVV